jgi:plastocyanin domain-containing protein
MFLFGAFSGMLVHRFSRKAAKISAAVVVIMGLMMIGRGLALSGVMLPAIQRADESGSDFAAAAAAGGIQYVTTEFGAYSYPPIQVRAGIPVEWTILVSERNYNSCNNAIELPAFGLKADLNAGKTRVTFTPKKEGDFIYTCWMGMIKSVIRVTPR